MRCCRHDQAEGARRDPAGAVASGRGRQAIATIDHLTNGRMAINVVSGWFKGEFSHRRALARARRTLSALERVHRSAERHLDPGQLHLQGRLLPLPRLHAEPKPLQKPHPEIFQGGSSRAARDMAASVSDWYFTNGNTPEASRRRSTTSAPRRLRTAIVCIGVNAFVIARDTEEEAGRARRHHRMRTSRRSMRSATR
jgi:FMNH2-dependent dimethyl sulfone monooxygenase